MAKGSSRETAGMRYLLGTLSQDDETRIEQAFFADDAKLEELEIAEAELIDAYVQKELSPVDQRQFETKLRASPPLLERIRFARVLNDKATNSLLSEQEVSSHPAYAASQSRSKPKLKWWEGLLAQPAFRVAVAAGVFIILVGGVALLFGWRNLRNESNQLASERAALQQQRLERDKQSTEQQAKAERLAADLQREREQRTEDRKLIEELQRVQERETHGHSILGTVASIVLTPGSLRSGRGRPELVLGTGTSTAQLKLALENNDYRSYSTTIKTADGDVVDRQNGLQTHKRGSGPLLILSIPARRLSPGDYVVDLDGLTASGQLESVNHYAFRVAKKTN